MDIIKLLWHLVLAERQNEMVTLLVLTSQLVPIKRLELTPVSVICRQFGSYFGLFDIAGYIQYTYIFAK
jgi:hypothetical protein